MRQPKSDGRWLDEGEAIDGKLVVTRRHQIFLRHSVRWLSQELH
jgi:hypothetical protein